MSKNILFIVEGKRDEPNLLISVFKRALQLAETDYKIFKFKSNIYSLYDKMRKDGYDSLLSMLYAMDRTIFPDEFVTPETAFSSVYLLFDLDPQSPTYSETKMINLCSVFDDETRNGKIYFSVPMSQSIFDFTSYNQRLFNNKKYKINNIASYYKKEARENSFLTIKYGTQSFKKIKTSDIFSIMVLNMKKYCYLVNENFDFRWSAPYNSKKLFDSEKPFIEDGLVSVICGGMLLIPDYSPKLVEEVKKLKD